MNEFTFQATLIASIRVKAETRAEAEEKLRVALAASDDRGRVKAVGLRACHAEGAYAHRFQVRDGRRQHVARLHHVNQARPIEAMRSASISTSREVARRVRMRAERERSDEARGRFEVGGAVSLLRPSRERRPMRTLDMRWRQP